MKEQVVDALELDIILKSYDLFVQLIEKESTVFHNGSEISSFEWEQRIELLDHNAYKNVPNICVKD